MDFLNPSRPLRFAALSGLILVLSSGLACGGGEGGTEPEEPVAEEAAETSPEVPPADGPRVFFTNLQDDEVLTSPIDLTFDVENFEIVAAQDPTVVEEGKGHHHLGIDTDCLAPGTEIEKADPWIHFGDGSNSIQVQLTPGLHRLTLQVGDGEHRTLDEEGLCKTVFLEVIQEGV